MKERLKKLWKWLRKEVLNRKMLLWFVIAELIFWSPCIVGGILALTINSWYWTVCTGYMAFWTLPLTPAIPLQIGLAYSLKKLAEACKRRKERKSNAVDKSKLPKENLPRKQ